LRCKIQSVRDLAKSINFAVLRQNLDVLLDEKEGIRWMSDVMWFQALFYSYRLKLARVQVLPDILSLAKWLYL